jgi:hypothetical protein
MNVYKRLNLARQDFHSSEIKKTGLNKFAGYTYFELGDFIVPAIKIFKDHGLIGIVSYGQEIAELRIINEDNPEEQITITSPMSEAALKGCHPVQNLGAVETYIRRYLWVSALEIVEHDALDMTTGKDAPKHKPTDGSVVTEKQMTQLRDVAMEIIAHMASDDLIGAYEEYICVTDAEEKTYLWSLLDSKVRSALKKHGESLKGN